jgi:hypothetical protein
MGGADRRCIDIGFCIPIDLFVSPFNSLRRFFSSVFNNEPAL